MDHAPLRNTLIGFLHPEIWQIKVSRIPSCCFGVTTTARSRPGLESLAMGMDSDLRFRPEVLRDLDDVVVPGA